MTTLSPRDIRLQCRDGSFTSNTSGLAAGYAQANLVILPKDLAFDFLLFCQRNPKPCPLLEVLDPGAFLTSVTADAADIRTDLPKYRVFVDGQLVDEPHDITNYWRDDLVTFVVGCSFSFEEALMRGGVPVRNIEMNKNVPMYQTNIPCASAGVFKGNLVVSMRPMTPHQSIKAVEITSRYAKVHGTPIHIGNESDIGIKDINVPEFGEAVEIRQNEVPVFWACGVTPQSVVMNSKPSFCITHSPGHMLVLDVKNEELSVS